MRIMQAGRADVDAKKLLGEVRATPEPSEQQIDAWAAEDGNAWTDEQIAQALWVYPPPGAEEVLATRTRLGLTEAQFAARFGFSEEEIRAYERGHRAEGHAASLLRIVIADPDAAARALDSYRRG